jgi:Ca-activated chloride channel family protein
VTFARPLLLLLLLALPLWWWQRRRRRVTVPFSDVGVVASDARPPWWTRLPPVLRSLVLICWIVAAAGPQVGGSTVEEKREGIAIAIAIDISSSMLAEDFAPSNRMEVAKQQAIEFVRGRKADRIGLVAFAGEALTQVPVTLDYAVVVQAIEGLRIGSLEDGTAIGSGLATAVNRLRRAPGKSKVVLLLTDGENNRGRIDPRTAAATAEAYGIKVYTIGVGTDGEARIPTGRGIGGLRYEVLQVNIDEDLLREIAGKTGGKYFRARDSEALSRIFHQIDALEKTPVTVTRYARYDEVLQPFVIAGLIALLLELALSATVAVRVP